jgi:hypothetical protein
VAPSRYAPLDEGTPLGEAKPRLHDRLSLHLDEPQGRLQPVLDIEGRPRTGVE